MTLNPFRICSLLLIAIPFLLIHPVSFADSLAEIPSQKPKAEKKLSAYQLRIINRVRKCPDGFQPEALRNSEFFRVANRKYIVQVMCYLGAYQGGYEYYLAIENASQVRFKPLNLLKVREDAGKRIKVEDNSLGGYPDYDLAKRELTVFTKGRGLGDCGTFARYRFENDRFVAKEIRVKSDCDGNYIEPEKYQKVYP